MNSYIAIFEIPATDISRAISFYEKILDLKIEKIEMPGMRMGILPYEDQAVAGVIVQGEGYEPSPQGVTVYLNGGDDLQSILDRIAENGGKIIVPKSAHADESGFYALFLDSEGNRIGLHSPS
ncbi:MAG: VOC family protein [Saprospiraceae bacterium]|nr:VOC family protein [Saprospiraceae bacterium]